MPTLLAHIKSGKLRPLAVTSAKRVDDLPQVPTIAESGYPGFEASTWFGFVAPTATPKDVVTRLNAEFNKALQIARPREKAERPGCAGLRAARRKRSARRSGRTSRAGLRIIKASGTKLD